VSTNTLSRIGSILETADLPSLGPDVRAGSEPLASLEQKLAAIFSDAKVSPSTQPLIRSLVLLWHDYLDESHSISQGIPSADGSFLHGIMHRREPDYGNAKYWFHRVGEHACYPIIAGKVGELLDDAKAALMKAELVRGDKWDVFAFVDACEEAREKRDTKTILLLQQIQKAEFQALLEHFLR
jgi:hypothetical protein